MEPKELSDEFVQLSHMSITNLLHCISSSGVKEKFIEDIGPKKYSEIINIMRNESTIINLRDFHNWVKLVLISNVVKSLAIKGPVSLLDIAVGRGGDLYKWNKSNVKYVFGFDKSEKSINNQDSEDPGARERLANFKGLRIADVQFEVGNASKPSPELRNSIDTFVKKNKIHGFKIVSCQFALHYFFKSEIDLKIVLTMVSNYIAPGGFFIGTTIDGEKIKNLFKDISEKVYSTSLFRINRNFNKKLKSAFGNEYTFTIFDTKDRTNYFNTIGLSTEYLVDFKVLKELAGTLGLVPVNLNFFDEYTSESKKAFTELKSNIISFDTILNNGAWKPKHDFLSDEEKELNGLYSTFVFMKV
jgi:mRNA (guanine-N7-)-methyltransferase